MREADVRRDANFDPAICTGFSLAGFVRSPRHSVFFMTNINCFSFVLNEAGTSPVGKA
jgi:hypothetical protein